MRLATICARAGSKRLPGKNTRIVNGWPLWVHTAKQAIDSKQFAFVCVSTDDEDIARTVRPWFGLGLIVRPPELATDEAGKVPVIRHVLTEAERWTGETFDHIIDLDVTAPLRTLDDIRGFCAKLDTIEDGGLVSVCKARRSAYFNQVELAEKDLWGNVDRARLVKWDDDMVLGGVYLRSQDAPVTYDMNASMTGWTRCYLLAGGDHPVGNNTYIFEMPRERSWDIDDEFDFQIVEFLMSKQRESVAA